jgi:hypothetical protein
MPLEDTGPTQAEELLEEYGMPLEDTGPTQAEELLETPPAQDELADG